MDFRPDEYEATVKIPVRVRKGRVRFFYGGALPALKDDTIGDLVVPAWAVLDEGRRALLQEVEAVQALPAGVEIAFVMKMDRLPEPSPKGFFHPEKVEWMAGGKFVIVQLLTPLGLLLRGTKQALLQGGRCYIPALDVTALSLNHAYTLLSTVYETDRRSHTGNVFLRGFTLEGDTWCPLQQLREREEARAEERFSKRRAKAQESGQLSLLDVPPNNR
jgi:hypothetical protein